MVVIGAAGTIDVPKPAVVIQGVTAPARAPIVIVSVQPLLVDLPPQPWLQPGATPKPPPPPPPGPKPQPKHPKKQGQATGGGSSDWLPECPPSPLYQKAIDERRFQVLFEAIETPAAEVSISKWVPKEETVYEGFVVVEPEREPLAKPVEIIVPVVVEVEKIVEKVVEKIVYVDRPMLQTASSPRVVTLAQIWPYLAMVSTIAIAAVVVTNVVEKPKRRIGRVRR